MVWTMDHAVREAQVRLLQITLGWVKRSATLHEGFVGRVGLTRHGCGLRMLDLF